MELFGIAEPTGKMLLLNPAWERLLGYSLEQLHGASFFDFLHPDDIQRSREALHELEDIQWNPSFTSRWRTIHGDWIPVEWSVRLWNDVIIANGRNVSDRIRAEAALQESEHRYKLLFDHMVSGFALHEIILDEAGKPYDYRYLEVNPVFSKLTGLSASQSIGKTIRTLNPAIEDYWIDAYGKVALTGKSIRFENYVEAVDRHFEIVAFSPRHGQFATIFTDISEKHKVADERERTLQEERARAEEQENLIYALSHDLRSPLVNLSGFSRELRNGVLGLMAHFPSAGHEEDVQGITESLRYIEASVARLERLQNGTLRYAKLGRQSMQIAKVDPVAVIQRIINGMQHQLREFECELIVSVKHKCKADEASLEQVFANLLENALKYSRIGVRPRIEIRSSKSGKLVHFDFQDNGKGIPATQRNKVFEMFHRLEPTGPVSGEGLGLTLVRSLLHRMNGIIEILESEPGKGSTFRITLQGV